MLGQRRAEPVNVPAPVAPIAPDLGDESEQSLHPHFDKVCAGAAAFATHLADLKGRQDVDFDWYPYDTMSNFLHIAPLITPECDVLFEGGKNYADIGAADGDMAFYLASLGNTCDIHDNAPTNYNDLAGPRHMQRVLGLPVEVLELDLDSPFKMDRRYDLIFLFGVLYHVKNPIYVLEQLAEASRYLLLGTRIARSFSVDGSDLSEISAAYLLEARESNNDPGNFWVFTEAGLRRLAERAGWDVVQFRTVGDVVQSNPWDADHDERAFALLRSRKR
jgi:tRNA (mo5U34)-methyltransferase